MYNPTAVSDRPSSHDLLRHRRPFEDLERGILERSLDRPGEVTPALLGGLRYVVNFAKMTALRTSDGRDVEVQEFLATHSARVRDALRVRLTDQEPTLWAAVRVLPDLVAETRAVREQLQQRLGVDREAVDREVCNRKVVLVLGGGGGAGYGYAGIFTLLARHGLDPHLICGTSIGALTGIFRARRARHDPSPIFASLRKLAWKKVFNFGPEASRYGLPATLRLHLRRAVGHLFMDDQGRVLTMRELSIPTHIVTTGLTIDALKHELSYYEHFLDDMVRPGMVFRMNRLSRVGNLITIFRELMSDPQALREVVFGEDPETLDADCVDAAGFSAAVPGLLHYDILREDPRMRALMDRLYAKYGITRLTEGGLISNVPARVGFRSAMEGRLAGHRNIYTIAVDCFSPRPRSHVFFPIQQIVRPNVLINQPYANTWIDLSRTLNPINLVPSVQQVAQASAWAVEDAEPHIPIIAATCTPFEGI